MPMFLMAPMQDGFPSSFASYGAADSSQWAWPAGGAWLNQAPQQFPMENAPANPQVMPAQFHMNMGTYSLESAWEPSATTLRQRRPLAVSTHKPQVQISGEYEEEPRGNSEADDALSRDMADELIRELGSTCGIEDQWSVLPRFQNMAFSNKISSRAAQLALEGASAEHAALLASSLQGHVRRAAQSKHANYVVQKIVEVLPMARASFVVEELLGVAFEMACHRFGCRLFCRILEHLAPGDKAQELVEEVLVNIEDLCSHDFGSYVVRHILEFGLPEHKHRVAMALRPRAACHAKHRLGSHVVEAVLKSCSPEDGRSIAEPLLANKEVAALATSQYGRHVVRALLAMSGALKQETEDALWQVEKELRQSRFGRGVLQSLRAAST